MERHHLDGDGREGNRPQKRRDHLRVLQRHRDQSRSIKYKVARSFAFWGERVLRPFFCTLEESLKCAHPFCRKCTPLDLSLKGVVGENEKGSAATVSGTPRSLISLDSIEKALQIKDFIKRNWTPIKIRMVSKLVSSYGAGGGTRTHTESPPADFESATSTIPSHRRIMIFDQDLHLLFHRANTAIGYYTPSPGKKQGIFSCRQGGTGINAKN